MSYSFATPQTIACQAPLSMGFPRQGYWSDLPFPSPRDLPAPEIKPASPALAGGFFTTEPPGKPPFNTRKFQLHMWLALYFYLTVLSWIICLYSSSPQMEVVELSLVTFLGLLSCWHFTYSPHPIFFSHASVWRLLFQVVDCLFPYEIPTSKK